MMRILAGALASILLAFAVSSSAQARVHIAVDLSTQTMHVSSATGEYDWPISSARSGFRTPNGSYGVQSLQAMHRSRKYHNAPMPHSIFFSGGYAIHGTYEIAALGSPASHGCIRIAPSHAAALFQMVQAEGARISISGAPPASELRYARAERRVRYASRYQARSYADGETWGEPGYAQYEPGYPPRGRYYSYVPAQAVGYAPVEPGLYQWLADQ
jgi:hypothetical protein